MSEGSSSEMGNGKCINNLKPLGSSLHIPHYIHVKPTHSSNFRHEYGTDLVQCYSIRQML